MVGPEFDSGWARVWQWLGQSLTVVGPEFDSGWARVWQWLGQSLICFFRITYVITSLELYVHCDTVSNTIITYRFSSRTCTYMCIIYTYMYIHVHAFIYAYMHTSYIHIYIHASHTCMHAHTHMHACMHTHTHVIRIDDWLTDWQTVAGCWCYHHTANNLSSLSSPSLIGPSQLSSKKSCKCQCPKCRKRNCQRLDKTVLNLQ